jgi:hypothetical protein
MDPPSQFILIAKRILRELRTLNETVSASLLGVQKQVESVAKQQHPKDECEKSPPVLRAELQIPEAIKGDWERENIKKACREYFAIGVSTATLFAVIAYAMINYHMLDEMRASSRPYTGVATISATYDKTKKVTVVLATIRNFGTTPAFNFSGTWSATIKGEVIPGFRKEQEPFTLFPGRSVGLQATFSKDHWDKIDSGEAQLILRARISYRFREDGPLTSYCEQNEYNALGKAFSPETCPK